MVTLHKTWLLYLRKSRQDDPNETVEEVLSKHETLLQEWAEREIGHRIPEEDIYREIVSGESIAAREEVQKVLARIEDPTVAGVIVMEPSRLSRGDLADCSRIIDSFRFSRSLVATPYMTYDLEKKMERKFFKDELLRGNDYLEYTKEILFRGRVAAHKRGCYLGRFAPYGYRKIKIGKDHTLEVVEAEADVVRLVFDLYVTERKTPGKIAQQLNEMGIPAPRCEAWKKDTIRHILRNQHYIGLVVFNRIKNTPVLENGEIVTKRLMQPEEDVIIAEGKHPAIVDRAVFERAQELVQQNPRVNHNKGLVNPYSGLLTCGKCGKVMFQHRYKHAETRYECRTRPRCYKTTRASEITEAILAALEHAELPALELKVKNGDGNARKIQQRRLAALEKQMEEYRAQEERQYDLLETNPNYPQEVFDRRNKALRAKMDECQAAIYQTKNALPQSIDYAERVVALKAAIKLLTDESATPEEQNRALKAIVQKIVFTGSPSYGTDKKRGIGVNDFTVEVVLRL